MSHKPKIIILEIISHKVTSMIIGMSVVAMFGIPLLQNIMITLIITSLTLVKDYFLRKYFYRLALKRFEDELTRSTKELDEILSQVDPYIQSTTISLENVDETDKNRQDIKDKARATDAELEMQDISQYNLESGDTIIMQLIDPNYAENIKITPAEDDLTYIWKKSGKNGLSLVKKETSGEDSIINDQEHDEEE